ncbi:hypothetical protein HFZ78_21740 [Priestia megaterium]|jgi:hypothetical protein|uniref:Uncharacterized protein n=1 Tax=Priestia megaterium TaxID=1404 RepID=A0A6H1P6G6_PRIMG|nr:hypothetical protein [Priestia megaterium]QIZ08997.1 hypothetical protein HFZ78_21740 [Priestia megaterium]
MMVCEWKTFSTDSETYTLEVFEEAVGDEFEALYFKENEEIPAYIWTVNYVVIVKKYSKVLTDILFEKIPRNPVCE